MQFASVRISTIAFMGNRANIMGIVMGNKDCPPCHASCTKPSLPLLLRTLAPVAMLMGAGFTFAFKMAAQSPGCSAPPLAGRRATLG